MVSLARAGPAFGQHEHGTPADSASGPSPVAGAAGVSLTRMSSGTAWLPDAARLRAYHATLGAWAVMLHGAVFLQYDRQSGTRAAEQLGSINWLMAVATRPVGRGAVRVRAMVSAEPWTVTGRGYPELLQVAEPYLGTTVTDRQHPHDLVSELAVLYERPLGGAGASLYLAPVGEPALGPVAYMHRPSAAYDPVAPLGHHAQDFTHISDGVATLGVFTRRVKLEGSVFNGAHPDEVRTDLDPVRLDAYGGRLSFNPSAGSSLAAWFGHIPATGGAHAHDVAVLERLEGILGLCERMDGNGDALLERESSMSGDVVGVRVRLEHAHDAKAFLLGRFEVRLDRVGGVDDERLSCPRVTDQIRGAAEIVVDELAEHHEPEATTRSRWPS